jgi:hypothetical protein
VICVERRSLSDTSGTKSGTVRIHFISIG